MKKYSVSCLVLSVAFVVNTNTVAMQSLAHFAKQHKMATVLSMASAGFGTYYGAKACLGSWRSSHTGMPALMGQQREKPAWYSSFTAALASSLRAVYSRLSINSLFTSFGRKKLQDAGLVKTAATTASSNATTTPITTAPPTSATSGATSTATPTATTTTATTAVSPVPLLTREQITYNESSINALIDNAIARLACKHSLYAIVVPSTSLVLHLGDLHGGGKDFIDQLNDMRAIGCFKKDNPWELEDGYYLVCTGDVADRGPDSILNWVIMLTLLVNNDPDRLFISRGNHEIRLYASVGQGGILVLKKSIEEAGFKNQLFDKFCQLFLYVPHVVCIGMKSTNDNENIYGIYSHSSLQDSVQQDVKQLLQRANQEPGKLQRVSITIQEALDEESCEAYEKISCSTRYHASTLFNDTGMPTLDSAQKFMSAVSGSGYRVLFSCCGHHHINGGVVALKPVGSWYGEENYWTPLTGEEQTVVPGSVYSVLSTTTPSMKVSCKAYSIMRFDSAVNTWKILPMISGK